MLVILACPFFGFFSFTDVFTPTMTAQEQLDSHLREIIQWHFSPETGCPFWLDWASKNFDPREKIQTFEDMKAFPHFEDEWLRDLQPEVWVPAAYKGRPFNIFETGGTTGMPKQRIGWEDYKTDYSDFSEKISDEHFPRGGAWLMMGPTGPRRLRLAIEHLANVRGSSCYFIDLDPRFVKKLISAKQFDVARQYMDHVVDQAATILKHRKVSGLFTTPKLLEALAEKVDIFAAGIRDHAAPIRPVHCGRGSGKPHRFLPHVREHLDGTGRECAAAPGGQFFHHLLCTPAPRGAPGRRSGEHHRDGPL
jgi:phenylacetate-coenzyme A ligase PaaK-like adenylate-forming protein